MKLNKIEQSRFIYSYSFIIVQKNTIIISNFLIYEMWYF